MPASRMNGTSKVYLAPCQDASHPLSEWQKFSVNTTLAGQRIQGKDGRCLAVWQCETRWPWWTVLAPCVGEDSPDTVRAGSCAAGGQNWTVDEASGIIRAGWARGVWPGNGGQSSSADACLMNEGSNVEIDQCGWALDESRMHWTFNRANFTVVSSSTKQCLTIADGLEVYAGPLTGVGNFTAILFNRSPNTDTIKLPFAVSMLPMMCPPFGGGACGLPSPLIPTLSTLLSLPPQLLQGGAENTQARVRDIVNHKDLPVSTGSFSAQVASHGVVHVNLEFVQ